MNWKASAAGSGPRLLFGSFLVTLLVFTIFSAVGGPYDFQSDHRLLPLFLFARGLPVYGDPANSPILSPLYLPLSFLAYFPALLFRSPESAIICAKLMAQLYTVAPVLWLLWRQSRRNPAGNETVVILMSLALLLISTSTVLGELTILHADAPALFFCFCACILTERVSEISGGLLLWTLAAACVLAPWAKQTAWPIALVPVIVLFRMGAWRPLVRFGTAYVIVLTVVSGFFFILFRDQHIVFWTLQVPALQMRHITRGLFVYAALFVLKTPTIPILGTVLICHLAVFGFRTPRTSAFRLENIFLLAALAGIPGSFLGLLKPGGGPNTVLYFAYFAFILALLWLQRLAGILKLPNGRRPAVTGGSVMAVMVFGAAVGWSLYAGTRLAWTSRDGFRETVAYDFMRRHPGAIWFPRYPLAAFLAEGKLYSCDMGLFDRRYAGIGTPDILLNKYIPNGGRLIACADDCQFQQTRRGPYQKVAFPDLPHNWTVKTRPTDGLLHIDGD